MGVAPSPESLAFLGPKPCAELAHMVEALRPYWIQRHPLAPFYTLGPASYLDAGGPGALAHYQKASAISNPQMDQAFGDFYLSLGQRLSDHLHAPVVMHPAHARPGFHIFEAHPAFEKPVASIHGDLQAQLLPWGQDAKMLPTLSFTMAVALPQAGAGMDVWAVDVAAWQAWPEAVRAAKLAEVPRQDVGYELGKLVVHSGRWVHRISPVVPFKSGERRVTLQGHGLFVDGAWQLYW